MKVGVTSLCFFMEPIEKILNFVSNEGFDSLELLNEGPYGPELLLENKEFLEPFLSYDLDYYVHSPNIDINISSINEGIRKESLRQIKESLKVGDFINAGAVTVHPGFIGRIDPNVRKMALEYACESIKSLVDFSEDLNTTVAVENMPYRPKFLGTSIEDLELFMNNTGCSLTIDTGHANTSPNPSSFFTLDNIVHYHIHDNNGVKDQHVPLGEGNFDLNLIKGIDEGILELNSYDKVLKSMKVLKDLNFI